MIMLTPITTPKKLTSSNNTMRPVSCLGPDTPFMRSSVMTLRRDKIVRRGCYLTEADIGDAEPHRDRFHGIVLGRRRYQGSQLGGLIPAEHDHRPVGRD